VSQCDAAFDGFRKQSHLPGYSVIRELVAVCHCPTMARTEVVEESERRTNENDNYFEQRLSIFLDASTGGAKLESKQPQEPPGQPPFDWMSVLKD
jgi:hypothetical protein